MALAAVLGALFMGLILGLLGSGGSILTVPILVFILHRPEKLAIAESLAIVGFIALIGAISYGKRGQIHWRSVIFFGIPGMIGAYVGACKSDDFSASIHMIGFGCVMLVVAGVMFFSPSPSSNASTQHSLLITIMNGFLVGCLTGLIGCGGGFLIVPALIFLNQLAMPVAVGTSLLIIAMNALTGFFKQMVLLDSSQLFISWDTIGLFTFVGIIGSLSGGFIAHRISPVRLKQFFSISIFFTGLYMLINQFY